MPYLPSPTGGCRNRCPGCFQPETRAFDYGSPFTEEVEQQIISYLSDPSVRGLTLLGGEPMEPENRQALLPFLKRLKLCYPAKTVWLFTGNLYEELIGEMGEHPKRLAITDELLSLVDVLVDGRFTEERKRLGLRFRGSDNQRIIDLAETRRQGRMVIWAGCAEDRCFDAR